MESVYASIVVLSLEADMKNSYVISLMYAMLYADPAHYIKNSMLYS